MTDWLAIDRRELVRALGYVRETVEGWSDPDGEVEVPRTLIEGVVDFLDNTNDIGGDPSVGIFPDYEVDQLHMELRQLLRGLRTCPDCDGDGMHPDWAMACRTCAGSGSVPIEEEEQ